MMNIQGAKLSPEGERFFKQLSQMAELEIAVGFQRGQDPYDDGTDLCDVAAFNEFGTSDTPARPFMRQSFENHQPELKKACQAANQTLGKGGTAADALKTIGVFCKGLVQQEIVDGDFEPNKPSTIRSKGSDKPLIDTAHMRQSVNYVVRKRGSDVP